MKGYISGFAAVLLAVVALSFTTTPKTTFNKITGKTVFDVCPDIQKKYFVISLPCDQQDLPNGQLDVSILRTASNYTLFGTGNTPPSGAPCIGDVCACVIWACPSVGNPNQPDLRTITDIYTQLGNYASSGTPVTNVIFEKE